MRQEADGNVGIMTKQIPETFCFFSLVNIYFPQSHVAKDRKLKLGLGKNYVLLVDTTNDGSVLFSGQSEIVSYLTSN